MDINCFNDEFNDKLNSKDQEFFHNKLIIKNGNIDKKNTIEKLLEHYISILGEDNPNRYIILLKILSFRECSFEKISDNFKPSKNNFLIKTGFKNDIDLILKNFNWIDKDDVIYIFLNNFYNFNYLSKHVKKIEKKLIISLEKEKYAFRKLLMLGEYFFIQPVTLPGQLLYLELSREDILESISYCLSLLKKKTAIQEKNIKPLQLNFNNQWIINIISQANFLRRYFHLENQISKNTIKTKLDELTLSVINPLSKNRFIGNLRQNIQRNHYIPKNQSANLQPLKIDQLISSLDLNTFFIKKSGPDRYVFEFINILDNNDIAKRIIEYINLDEFTYDEYLLLYTFCMENHIHLDKLLEFKINLNLQFKDLIKFRRLFYIFAEFQKQFFVRHMKGIPCKDNEQNIPKDDEWLKKDADIIRSLSISFGENCDLYKILVFLFEEDKLQEILKILSFTQESKFIDLQYTPIFRYKTNNEEMYQFLNQIFCGSDILRNTLVKNKIRLFENNTEEPVVDMLYNSLKTKFNEMNIFKNKIIRSSNKQQEIDLMLLTSKYVFIFEIKNTITPASDTEERTLIDCIEKSIIQLNNAEEIILANKNPDFMDKEIIKSTILGTRSFAGMKYKNILIQHILEFTNFIETGIITTESGNEKLWSGDYLSEDDLANYLRQDTPFARKFSSKINFYLKISEGSELTERKIRIEESIPYIILD